MSHIPTFDQAPAFYVIAGMMVALLGVIIGVVIRKGGR